MITVSACDGAIAADAATNARTDASRTFFMNIRRLERTHANPEMRVHFRLHEKFSDV
ncbi:hypothetical protein [Mesorhizobium sp. WSM4311]|uniref:hypothetical protein n=1 Tax=Mesorhizobium sp. WSM4311 TaxID=2029410 RepID=UPI0015C88672|nr:hypothetical protein [Mesorhizobium sp. WSM4311]